MDSVVSRTAAFFVAATNFMGPASIAGRSLAGFREGLGTGELRGELRWPTCDHNVHDARNFQQRTSSGVVFLDTCRVVVNKDDQRLIAKIAKIRNAVLLDFFLNFFEIVLTRREFCFDNQLD